MAVGSKFSIKSQTKSISLPCRSHPSTSRIEELLNKIKTRESRPSAEAICSGLSQLTRLYECMNDLLTSSTTQVLLSQEQNKKWVDELVDDSIKLLDVCGSISNMLSEIKAQSRDLYSALRRKKADFNVSIMKYICFKKNLKKDVRGLVNMITCCGGSVVVDLNNHHLGAVIKAVIGVSETTVSVLESLLLFFSMPTLKLNRWSFVVSKFMHKGMVSCEDEQEKMIVNEFESVDDVLRILCKYGLPSEIGDFDIAQSRLERLGDQIESMENRMEIMFRCLVKTRVLLLNIISQ